MTQGEFDKLADSHYAWLASPSGGNRMVLCDEQLEGLNMSGRMLDKAVLVGCYAYRANMTGASLVGATVSRTPFIESDMSRGKLNYASFAMCNFFSTKMVEADMRGTIAYRCDFCAADLSGAKMAEADLGASSLFFARLPSDPDAALALARARACPPEGPVVGWKKCDGGVLVKLMVPAEARRGAAPGRKCRAEFADVLEVVGAEVGKTRLDTTYRAGERVVAKNYDENPFAVCAGGIHFFLTREEAEAY